MNSLISFIIVLGVLIFVHELGHFLFAKLFRVRVLTFSLGFGPKLISKVVGETEYVISAFPLGGYVKMFGENPDEQDVPESEKEAAFARKPVWQRFVIVLAGPVFNFLLPVILFFFLFAFNGVPEPIESTKVGKVVENSPAQEAGIIEGDRFLAIDGVETEKWIDVLEGIKTSDGNKTNILLLRGNEEVEVVVVPALNDAKNIFGEVVEKRYMIGIAPANEYVLKEVGLSQSFVAAINQTYLLTYYIWKGFVKIIQRKIPASEIGGPILIFKMSGEQMKAGWTQFIRFMAFLSINLGILNLLPIPVLDGGHLIFLTAEAIRRKPLDQRAQLVVQQIGLAFLLTVMIFVFYNDIMRFFQ